MMYEINPDLATQITFHRALTLMLKAVVQKDPAPNFIAEPDANPLRPEFGLCGNLLRINRHQLIPGKNGRFTVSSELAHNTMYHLHVMFLHAFDNHWGGLLLRSGQQPFGPLTPNNFDLATSAGQARLAFLVNARARVTHLYPRVWEFDRLCYDVALQTGKLVRHSGEVELFSVNDPEGNSRFVTKDRVLWSPMHCPNQAAILAKAWLYEPEPGEFSNGSGVYRVNNVFGPQSIGCTQALAAFEYAKRMNRLREKTE